MKGYTNTNALAVYMGASFTASQELIADLAIGAAEAWIDNNIRHAWLEIGPITETVYMGKGGLVQVRKPPVKTFDTVSVTWWPGNPQMAQPLDGTCGQYTVRSLRDGVLWLPYSAGAHSVQIVYTPNDDPVPDVATLATLALASANLRMMPAFNDDADPTVVQRYMVGGELEVEFRKNLMAGANVSTQQALSYLDEWVKGHVVV